MNCGALIPPTNGNVTIVQAKTGEVTTAQYSCHPGYRLLGKKQLVCDSNANGPWTGEIPACIFLRKG